MKIISKAEIIHPRLDVLQTIWSKTRICCDLLRYAYLILYMVRYRRQAEWRIKRQIQEPIGGDESKEEEDYSYKDMIVYDERDAGLLSLIGSFLKSAPHLILQIYILVIRGTISSFASEIAGKIKYLLY